MCSADALRRSCVQVGHNDRWRKEMLVVMLEDVLEGLLEEMLQLSARIQALR